MRMYNKIELTTNLTIGVTYDYEKMRISINSDLPNDPAKLENIKMYLLGEGSLEDFAEFVEYLDGKFFEFIEAKLYELNE